MTGIADAVIHLGRLALAFGRIDRTACYHPDGTKESDTDHTVMLGWIAPALAAKWFPWLDVGLVAQYALLHDMPEVYAGDTPTLRIDAAGRAAKARREAEAVEKIAGLFAPSLPWVPVMLRRYEAQQEAEARFVRGVDKLLPKIVHLLSDCADLGDYGMTSAELAGVLDRQEADMRRYVGEFTELMGLRDELAARTVSALAEREARETEGAA